MLFVWVDMLDFKVVWCFIVLFMVDLIVVFDCVSVIINCLLCVELISSWYYGDYIVVVVVYG